MSGYVYLIGTPTFGWYKIGKSIKPEVRIKDLGILLPFKVEVIGVWKAENHHLLEKTLHEMYSEHKINGEWFEFTRTKIIDLTECIPDAARIYPSDCSLLENLDRFSNVEQDKRNNRRVIGVRTQKLRGNFTPEEREQKRIAAMAEHKKKKEIKELAKYK